MSDHASSSTKIPTTWDKWRYVPCSCHGGLVGGHDGYPRDCPSCRGNGGFYVTANGAVAEYPGGPLNGRDNDHSMWERGKPVETIVGTCALTKREDAMGSE